MNKRLKIKIYSGDEAISSTTCYRLIEHKDGSITVRSPYIDTEKIGLHIIKYKLKFNKINLQTATAKSRVIWFFTNNTLVNHFGNTLDEILNQL